MLNLPVSAPGQYVLVMVYHSGQLVGINNLEVDVASPGARETGYLSLHGCPYRYGPLMCYFASVQELSICVVYHWYSQLLVSTDGHRC